MAELTFTWEVDGDPVSADSVVLCDPTSAYGLRVSDLGTVVIAANVAMVEGDPGEYTLDIDAYDLDEDTVYDWWAKVVFDGETYFVQSFINISAGDVEPVGSKTIRFVVVDTTGAPVEATSVKLSNPTESYGAIRLDTGAKVTADNTAFTLEGLVYSVAIGEPVADLTYRYYVEVVHNSATYWLPRTTAYVQSAMLAIGRYTSSERIEKAFGVDNVHKWLGIDDTDDAVDYALRAHEFITAAEAEIDDLLRGGPCNVPFTIVPAMITTIATNLAGVRFYEARGVVDTNPETGQVQHRLQFQAKWAERQIGRIKAGQIKLSVDNVTRHPVVVKD